jgi:alpha-ketoglutarate-dependent taurine dioxygenase
MDTFQAHYADISDAALQERAASQLAEHGLVTFSGITSRAALSAVAARFLTIRPHRDAGPDGFTVITGTRCGAAGFAAFTDRELVPHTDGSSVRHPPGLLILACLQPAAAGGTTLLADGAQIAATLASQHPTAWHALSSRTAAAFGAPGYVGAVFGPAGAGRRTIRLRIDDLARFSAEAAAVLPLLRTIISQHLHSLHLHAGEAVMISNTRWLHGREPYTGQRVMLRVLGDPMPSLRLRPGFPARPQNRTGQVLNTIAGAA